MQRDMLNAARAGHEDIVARLISMDPSLLNARTTTNGEQQTALHLAAKNGHDGVVAQLLALSPQASVARDYGGRTALHFAAEYGRDKVVARLLAHNPALIDAVSSRNETVLHLAAFGGYESTVMQLLNHSPGLIALKNAHDQTALHLAASGGHVKVVAQLLAFCPQSSDARDDNGRTALHFAAECGHDKVVARLLAHNPALIDAVRSGDKMTALHLAACNGHEVIVMQLLNHSPGLIDLKTAHMDQTALHLAASGGYVKVVAELLARRPSSLADEDWEGQTPLFCAASHDYQEVVDLFPLTTDQVHHRDRCDNTLLHLVIGGEGVFKPALIQRVWEMNPDALFVANSYGCMPFDFALSSANEWAIEHFQWKISLWSVEEALVKEMRRNSHHTKEEVKALQRREQRFRELVQGECERPLLLSLPRDCVHLISDYLFISDSIFDALEAMRFHVKRAKNSSKPSDCKDSHSPILTHSI